MANDNENIDRIFKIHEDAQENSRKIKEIHIPTGRISAEEREWADSKAAEEDETPQTRYHPIQRMENNRSGCLGGLMYAVFILCISVVLAVFAWIAASDALALNKEEFTATVVLPKTIFRNELEDVVDEEGNVTGQKTVAHADISYVSNVLKQAGLIENRWLFEFFCKIAHADTKVKPGEYELSSTYDYRALIQNMRPNGGGAVTVNVTFAEGMTMQQMFVLLERSGVSSYEDLMEAAAGYHFNYSFLGGEPEDGDEEGETDAVRLEGYLFPETYNFYVNMQASSAINKFLEEFNSKLTEEFNASLESSGRTLQEIVTVASMIEKEAADDGERAAIASVIYNRLAADMPLGIDATILYIHPDHEGAPTAEMLKEKSPYNTRLQTGLPPTPICNPGLPSLEAALRPNNTDYYYYALDTETGRHRFFTTAEEFNDFVATQDY
ncbi:MAG: endolytic transglycosylase MltG [Oscillospiraceae bacterium]|nr:endolytic transglycosylase MltG [Oscillospiraceae bacterium]